MTAQVAEKPSLFTSSLLQGLQGFQIIDIKFDDQRIQGQPTVHGMTMCKITRYETYA